jgi:uncharacterized protein (TIGR02145 family)
MKFKTSVLLSMILFLSIISHSQTNQVTDIKGKVYKTIVIGEQEWMAENLSCKSDYGNFWAFDNDETNVEKFGYLYNWEAAQNICPTGWRLPSKNDLQLLLDSAGRKGKNKYNAIIQGGSSGFEAMFGGWRHFDGVFRNMHQNSLWWSSEEHDESNAWALGSSKNRRMALLGYHNKENGFSVRCVKK